MGLTGSRLQAQNMLKGEITKSWTAATVTNQGASEQWAIPELVSAAAAFGLRKGQSTPGQCHGCSRGRREAGSRKDRGAAQREGEGTRSMWSLSPILLGVYRGLSASPATDLKQAAQLDHARE